MGSMKVQEAVDALLEGLGKGGLREPWMGMRGA